MSVSKVRFLFTRSSLTVQLKGHCPIINGVSLFFERKEFAFIVAGFSMWRKLKVFFLVSYVPKETIVSSIFICHHLLWALHPVKTLKQLINIQINGVFHFDNFSSALWIFWLFGVPMNNANLYLVHEPCDRSWWIWMIKLSTIQLTSASQITMQLITCYKTNYTMPKTICAILKDFCFLQRGLGASYQVYMVVFFSPFFPSLW